jgi:hypothetical protein
MNSSGQGRLKLWLPALLVLVAAGLCLVILMVPRRLAVLRCSDGSALTIRAVTFGTNHVWRGSFAGAAQIYTSAIPTMAIWGEWHSLTTNTHRFRYELFHEPSGTPWTTLKQQQELPGPGVWAGLLAVTTNSPGMFLVLRVREEDPVPVAILRLRDKAAIQQHSSRSKGLKIRLVPYREWTIQSLLMIANEGTAHEILVEKIYQFGPLMVSRQFE